MNALSLFSGIGGLDLAAEWAGFKTVAFCERDEFCQKVLRKHWPEVRIFDDVRTLDTSELPAIELLHGGYPCQPFSTVGNRRGEADKRHMWPHMLRIVRELKPRWVVGENVKGHITLGLDTVCNDLEGEGYTVRAVCTPAHSVGANHKRERVFVIANTESDRRMQRDEDESRCGTGVFKGAKQRPWDVRSFTQQEIEAGVCGTSDGLPRRVDRLRCLGNSVSPQQAYPIFAAIAETYNA